MNLPKPNTPAFTVELMGEVYTYHLLKKKDEKNVLMIAQTDNANNRIAVVSDLVKEKTLGKVDPRVSPRWLTEYIYLCIIRDSISSSVEFQLPIEIEGKRVNVDALLDFSTIGLDDQDKPTTNLVDISGEFDMDVKVQFREPTIHDIPSNDVNAMSHLIYNTIEYIHMGDDSKSKQDLDKDEFIQWLDELSGETFNKLAEHVNSYPKTYCMIRIYEPDSINKETKSYKEERLHDILNFMVLQ